MQLAPRRIGIDRAIDDEGPEVARLPGRLAVRVMTSVPQCIKLVKGLVVVGVVSAKEPGS